MQTRRQTNKQTARQFFRMARKIATTVFPVWIGKPRVIAEFLETCMFLDMLSAWHLIVTTCGDSVRVNLTNKQGKTSHANKQTNKQTNKQHTTIISLFFSSAATSCFCCVWRMSSAASRSHLSVPPSADVELPEPLITKVSNPIYGYRLR